MGGEQGSARLIPRHVVGVDIRALPIGPKEAFVLSQIDGRSSEHQLALATGLSTSEVEAVLLRLEEVGAISYGNGAAPPRSGTNHGRPPSDASRSGTQRKLAPPGPPVPDLQPPPYDPSELQESADLDEARKHLILSTFYSLERTNHYELLKVPSSAEKKDIKRAYYDSVSVFHPDRYFGKNLGSFKPKLEKIFQLMTEAHDTLTRSKSREEYDRYLESQAATGILSEQEAATTARRIAQEIDAEARMIASAITMPAPAGTGAAAHPVSVPHAATVPAFDAADSRRSPSPEERRQALARKFAGTPSSARIPVPAMPAASPQQAASEALRDRYERRVAELRDGRVERFVKQADEALAAGNKVAAANALRVAVSLSPDDPALAARFRQVDQEAAATLVDKYLEQARYEERVKEYLPAAEAYERAARGKPTAQLLERAAHCLLEGRGDSRRAVELGRKAVELAPTMLAGRITLARAYAAAGMDQSALGELERARSLAPEDDSIKDWVRRIKRGEG